MDCPAQLLPLLEPLLQIRDLAWQPVISGCEDDVIFSDQNGAYGGIVP